MRSLIRLDTWPRVLLATALPIISSRKDHSHAALVKLVQRVLQSVSESIVRSLAVPLLDFVNGYAEGDRDHRFATRNWWRFNATVSLNVTVHPVNDQLQGSDYGLRVKVRLVARVWVTVTVHLDLRCLDEDQVRSRCYTTLAASSNGSNLCPMPVNQVILADTSHISQRVRWEVDTLCQLIICKWCAAQISGQDSVLSPSITIVAELIREVSDVES